MRLIYILISFLLISCNLQESNESYLKLNNLPNSINLKDTISILADEKIINGSDYISYFDYTKIKFIISDTSIVKTYRNKLIGNKIGTTSGYAISTDQYKIKSNNFTIKVQ